MATLKSRIGSVVLPLLPVNRRTFSILRHEYRAWTTSLGNRFNPGHWKKVASLRSQSELSLNLGSGGKGLPGWINVELIRHSDTTLCLDIRRPLPLPDGSIARIFAEHVVEHMDFDHDVPPVFRDWYRLLQPGGIVRIIVPDGDKFLQAYATGDKSKWRDLGWDLDQLPSDLHTPMHVINHIFHQGGEHLFAYDFETLAFALRKAGFSQVAKADYLISRDPKLAIDQANHGPYSLYVEAMK